MKKVLLFLIFTCLFLTSCAEQRFNTQLFGYLDTVVSIDGYFESREEFDRACEITEDILKKYDKIFDIYNDGELKALNEKKELSVSAELSDAVAFGIEAAQSTDGYCNIAMGSVLSLWHEARESDIPYLPDPDMLTAASGHTSVGEISLENGFVRLNDKEASLDMGAVAKGIVSDVLRQELTEAGFGNMLINLGGNVVVIGNKDGKGWNVGIQSPDGEGITDAVAVSDACLVTSGSYQRYFEYNGKRYHHIINPDTLYPSDMYSSVSVLYENGAWADALSTALFNMTVEQGEKILQQFDNIGVMWITSDGEYIYYGTLKK